MERMTRSSSQLGGCGFLLWIDGVGGYWVCTKSTAVIGRPPRESAVEIPVMGDLSKQHARIVRDDAGYCIEAIRDVWIDDKPVRNVALLKDGSRIQLGQAVTMRFRQPNPLSLTARLDFLSPHRTDPSTDGVILMADLCVLGPTTDCHVPCRRWNGQVVLHRNGDSLFCRGWGEMEIDGEPTGDRGIVTLNSRVTGDEFSFSLEEWGAS
jgi:hypothetical protein